MSPKALLAAIAAGCGGLMLTSCAHPGPAADDERLFPRRIVTPVCANAHPPITLDVLRVARDPQARKPSSLRHYLVDLRIRRKDRKDLWLLVNQESFPSAVDSVAASVEKTIRIKASRPREVWWFSGNDIVGAYRLGRAAESSFESLEVGTSDSEIPVTLGTIEVDGLSPQEWVRRTGGRQPNDADEPRVAADFEPYCTTWIDVTDEAASRAE